MTQKLENNILIYSLCGWWQHSLLMFQELSPLFTKLTSRQHVKTWGSHSCIKITVFRAVTPCSLVHTYQCLRRNIGIYLPQTAQYCIPVGHNLEQIKYLLRKEQHFESRFAMLVQQANVHAVVVLCSCNTSPLTCTRRVLLSSIGSVPSSSMWGIFTHCMWGSRSEYVGQLNITVVFTRAVTLRG
jgi:hypothetical protein